MAEKVREVEEFDAPSDISILENKQLLLFHTGMKAYEIDDENSILTFDVGACHYRRAVPL